MASETSAGTPPEPASAAEEPQAAVGTAGVWDMYFGQDAPSDGSVNWEAYSHEELYQMLWQDADVADVSSIAAEWSGHRSALVNHAQVLREQRAALLQSWRGTGAEQAAGRLSALADRVEKLAELAHAGEQASEQAADALARARSTMPPPPGDPAAPMNDAATNWADITGASLASAPDRSSQPAVPGAGMFSVMDQFATGPEALGTSEPAQEPSTSTAQSASDAGAAFGAVGSAGFSFYAGADSTDLRKQQAVRSMQGYESSLTNSGQLIGQARSTIPAATTSAASKSPGKAAGSDSSRLLAGAGSGSGTAAEALAAGAVVGTLSGGAGAVAGLAAGAGQGSNPLLPGKGVGTATMQGGTGATAARLAAESAAGRPGAMGGMVPPASGVRGGQDEAEHENQLPTINHELFPVAEPGSEAVIGSSPEDQS